MVYPGVYIGWYIPGGGIPRVYIGWHIHRVVYPGCTGWYTHGGIPRVYKGVPQGGVYPGCMRGVYLRVVYARVCERGNEAQRGSFRELPLTRFTVGQ